MKQQKAVDLKKLQQAGLGLLAPDRARITVGMATCGLAKGAGKIVEALKYEIKKQKVKAEVGRAMDDHQELRWTCGSHWRCCLSTPCSPEKPT